jgi:branched-subunit amino acid aminotransferase/4-amino-4-deoxychorismate lyase
MTLPIGRYRFNGSALSTIEHPSDIALLVADSWLVQDGRVARLEDHFARFCAGAETQGLVTDPQDFLELVRDALPTAGEWFPRIELTSRGELQLLIRSAPERTESVSLWTSDHDPRTQPTIKGPDLPALESLRAQARAHGASEAVILTSEGSIVDGVTTCLLWWKEDRLGIPPRNYARVNSVTQRIVESMAAERGVAVVEEAQSPDQLVGCEVWAVNALHGLRPARSWLDVPGLSVNETRLALWRDAYENYRELVTN